MPDGKRREQQEIQTSVNILISRWCTVQNYEASFSLSDFFQSFCQSFILEKIKLLSKNSTLLLLKHLPVFSPYVKKCDMSREDAHHTHTPF